MMIGIAIGKYERTSVENYDKFLQALDMNFLLRKVAAIASIKMEIQSRKLRNRESSRQWTITTSSLTKSSEIRFKLDEKFDETTIDGREYESIMRVEDNTFVCLQKPKKKEQKSVLVVREFSSEGCTMTMGIVGKEIVCTQHFKRI